VSNNSTVISGNYHSFQENAKKDGRASGAGYSYTDYTYFE